MLLHQEFYFYSSLAKVVSNFMHGKNINASSFLFQKRKIQNMLCGEITRTRREFSPWGGEIRLPHTGNVFITFPHIKYVYYNCPNFVIDYA